jgi:EthD domain
MIKIILTVRKRPDMTRKEFETHLRDKRIPLFKNTTSVIRHLRCYVQNYIVDDHIDLPFAFSDRDSVNESWFDDIESVRRCFAEPAYEEIIRPDAENFSDTESLIVLFTKETKMVPIRPAIDNIKAFVYLKRKAGMPEETFRQYWQEIRGPALAKDAHFQKLNRGYVVNKVLPGKFNPFSGSVSEYDVVDEMWFEDIKDLEQLYRSSKHYPHLAEDEASFIDLKQSFVLLARESLVHGEYV